MKLKVADDTEQTRRMVDLREKAISQSLKKRVAKLRLVFAPGKMHGWQIAEKEECS